jgi:hypothetical protein
LKRHTPNPGKNSEPTPLYFVNPYYLQEIERKIDYIDDCSWCGKPTKSTPIFIYGKQTGDR